MEDKKTIMLDKACPDLLVPPHIVDTLFHLVMGEWHYDPAQQELLVAHLTECSYCRMSLIVMLATEQKEERMNSYPEEPLHNLLTQFVTIHHEIVAKDYEQMGAYAEAIIAEGRDEADKRFLVLAEHIRKCPSCKSTLDETLDFLNNT
jgi:hypothetical protein